LNLSRSISRKTNDDTENKIMRRKYSFGAISVLLLAAALVAGLATLARIALAEGNTHLAGTWNFNQGQSDDASQKVHDAELSTEDRGGGSQGGGYPSGGGYPGGGYPGVGGIGFPGGRGGIGGPMGRGGRRGGGAAQPAPPSHQDLERLAATPKTLRIEQDEKKITITDEAGQIRNLYPDKKKHKETDSSGQETAIKTHWDNGRLIAESKLGHSGKLAETYELSQDGKQLYVISQLDNSRLSSPLVIRRVYDRAAENAK
jgi:hypothetical protein